MAVRSMLLDRRVDSMTGAERTPFRELGEWCEKAEACAVEHVDVLRDVLTVSRGACMCASSERTLTSLISFASQNVLRDLAPSYVAPSNEEPEERREIESRFGAYWKRTVGTDVRARRGLLSSATEL